VKRRYAAFHTILLSTIFMRGCLFFLLSLLWNFVNGQEQLSFARFIKTDTAIKWAGIYDSYINLGSGYDLRKYYQNKPDKNAAFFYNEAENGRVVIPVKLTIGELQRNATRFIFDENKMNWTFEYEDKAKADNEKKFLDEANNCDSCLLINKFAFFRVKQLLYYKNHRLYVNNILANPVIYVKDSQQGMKETVYSELPGFAFNNCDEPSTEIPSSAVYISTSVNRLVFTPGGGNPPATLIPGGSPLFAVLYKDLKKNMLKAYNADKNIYPESKNKLINPAKIDLYKSAIITIPIYDADGEGRGGVSYLYKQPEINLDSIYRFIIAQDFYFDPATEKCYSKLKALVPERSVITNQGEYLGKDNYYGIIFPKEKKKKTIK
jgi:hypothetical protein